MLGRLYVFPLPDLPADWHQPLRMAVALPTYPDKVLISEAGRRRWMRVYPLC